MTNAQLIPLLTSADDAQIKQVIAYFEQQKQIPQDLLAECFVAWQLVKDKKIRKQLLELLQIYTPNAFQIFLANKYLLEKQKDVRKANKLWKEIARHQIMDTQKLTYYLCSFFPSLLFSQISLVTDPDLKKSLSDKFKNVESLSLTDIKLVQADFTLLQAFKNLKKLALVDCKLTQLPAVINEFTVLEELNVSTNPISVKDFNFLDQLPQLQKFEIWRHKFEKQVDLTIANQLKQLKNLRLWGCDFTQLPALISELLHIEELDLRNNNLSQADFTLLQRLKNLKKLDLRHCKLTKLPVVITDFTSLKELDLKNNKLSQADFTLLQGLKNLKKLDLVNCGLSQLPAVISELTSLEELNLSHNLLSQTDFVSLQGLKNLKKLDLRNCGLIQLPAAVSILTNLEELDLSYNLFSQANFTPLQGLENLKNLDLWVCGFKQLPIELKVLQEKGVEISWS